MAPSSRLALAAGCLAASLRLCGGLGFHVQALSRDQSESESEHRHLKPAAVVENGYQGSTEPLSVLDATLRKSGIVVEGPLTATPLIATQILFVSSPAVQKIVYTELRDFKSITGMTYPLVDSGLVEPCGLAIDRRRGDLYVADRGQKMIFRYSLLAHQDVGGHWQLQTDGTRATIVSNRSVEWISLDQNGTLYFTDKGKNSVNKITKQVLDMLAMGDYVAEDLQAVTEREQERSQLLQIVGKQHSGKSNVSEEAAAFDATQPRILSMYEGGSNPEVSSPAGVVADGPRLFWANGASGTSAGTVVQGQAAPWASPSPNTANGLDSLDSHFPTVKIANSTDKAYSVTKTNTLLFFTGENTARPGHDAVFGVDQYGGPVYTVAPGLSKPRGLVWDGDNTVFVADEAKNTVWSMPAGRLVASAPLGKAVDFTGAYGVALISKNDAGFSLMTGHSSPIHSFSLLLWLALAAAGVGAR